MVFHVPLSVVLYSFMLVCVVYFPKILRCILLKAKVVSLGRTELQNNFKITLFLNMKQHDLTGRTAEHYRTKFITAGKCQGFTNVSTTSAICFCCEFFILHLHHSLPLFLLPQLPPHIALPSRFSCVLSLSCFYLCAWVSPSLPHLTSSLEFYLRGVTSPGKAGFELGGEQPHQTKQERDPTFIPTVE